MNLAGDGLPARKACPDIVLSQIAIALFGRRTHTCGPPRSGCWGPTQVQATVSRCWCGW